MDTNLKRSEIEAEARKLDAKLDSDPRVIWHPDGTAERVLAFPFTYGEQKVERVRLSRPKGKHLKTFLKDNDIFEMCQCLGDILATAWDEMDATDVMVCTAIVGRFLEPYRETGGTTT